MRPLNRTELADIFGVNLTTIDNWVRRGCPYISKGGKGKEWRFDLDEVKKWHENKDKPLSYLDRELLEEIKPGTTLSNYIAYCLFRYLIKIKKISPEKIEKYMSDWIKNKPDNVIEMEDYYDDWLRKGK